MLWITLLTWFKGELMGKDSFGNQYYRAKGKGGVERRWVLYKGFPEASKVPPEWHGWLHYQSLSPPTVETIKRWPWGKKHLPNLSGTPYAYHPSCSLFSDGITKKPPGSYEAWKPNKVEDENKSA